MQPLQWKYRPDGLRAPALVCAFKGWNDAGDAASTAGRFVGRSLGAHNFATIDPEEFYDFQQVRPQVRMVDGDTRSLIWPEVKLWEVKVPGAPRDLVMLSGHEPSYRWRTFTGIITELAEAMGVQMVVTLGALLADVPHTRPVNVSGFATDPGLVQRLSLQEPSYEGPTGILGAVGDACTQAGIPCASLWAAVPHYIPAAPNPKAALALVRKLEGLVGVAVDGSELEAASAEFERQVAFAVQHDPEIQAFVERLEAEATEDDQPHFDVPSGDSLERDFQRFLRQRDQDNQ